MSDQKQSNKKASEAIFEDNEDDFVKVEVDQNESESKVTPEKANNKSEEENMQTPDKEDTGGSEPLRKSLEGLSPQQDAKVGTLK